jgi:hypothetical protein
MSLLRRKSLKPPRRLTGPNKPPARASGAVTRDQTGRFAGASGAAGLPQLRGAASPASY